MHINTYTHIHTCIHTCIHIYTYTCRILLGDYWNVIGFPQLKNKREIADTQTHTHTHTQTYTYKIFKG